MSKQTSTEPLTHIQVVSSALRQPDQPAATFRALDAAMKAVIGHKVLTVLLYHSDLQETERFYSSDLDSYPIAGRKDLRPTAWTKRLFTDQQCYIGYTAADIREFFLDHALIHSLGCDAILNVPVVYNSETLGTVNLLHEEGWYDKGDTELAMTIANIAAPSYLQIRGGG